MLFCFLFCEYLFLTNVASMLQKFILCVSINIYVSWRTFDILFSEKSLWSTRDSRGGNSGNACFVSLWDKFAPILDSGVLHVMPYMCHSVRTFEILKPIAHSWYYHCFSEADFSALYYFFSSDSCCKVCPWSGPVLSPRGEILSFWTSACPVAWWPSTPGSPSHVCGFWDSWPG